MTCNQNNVPKLPKFVFITLAIAPLLSPLSEGYSQEDPFAGTSLPVSQLPILSHALLVTSNNPEPVEVALPHTEAGSDREQLYFRFTLAYETGESTLFRIIPDDCLEALTLDGVSVVLPEDVRDQRFNWQDGFVIDLINYLHEGNNDVNIVISNKGRSPTGLAFAPISPDLPEDLQ